LLNPHLPSAYCFLLTAHRSLPTDSFGGGV
jgi:hypothetical protein